MPLFSDLININIVSRLSCHYPPNPILYDLTWETFLGGQGHLKD